jgi:branched-chain amino acid transport system permease protein
LHTPPDVSAKAVDTKANRRADLATSVATGRGALLVPRIVTVTLAAAGVVAAGLLGDSTLRYSLIIGTVLAIAILGSNAVTGALGEINLGSSANMAFGAYSVTWALKEGWSLWSAVLFAVVFGFVSSAILAVPTVRLRGVFTALTTFALAFAIPDLSMFLSEYTGGEMGTAVPATTIAGTTLDTSSGTMLGLVVAVFLVVAIVSSLLFSGTTGRTMLTVSEASPAAHVFGLRVTAIKIAIWTWSGTLGALAGAFYALTAGFINTTMFTVFLAVSLLAGGLIGGSRSVTGALIGGLVVGTLPMHIQSVVPAAATGLVFGIILLLALLTGRNGLAGLLEKFTVRYLMRRSA